MPEVDRIRRVIVRYAPDVDDPDEEAVRWAEQGFGPAEVEAWFRAGTRRRGSRVVWLDTEDAAPARRDASA